jgi:large subunit ribosomal protein L13
MIKKLKIYAQGAHPHSAQQPKPLQLQNAPTMGAA